MTSKSAAPQHHFGPAEHDVVLHALPSKDGPLPAAASLYRRRAGDWIAYDTYFGGWPLAQWRELIPRAAAAAQVRAVLRGPGQVRICGASGAPRSVVCTEAAGTTAHTCDATLSPTAERPRGEPDSKWTFEYDMSDIQHKFAWLEVQGCEVVSCEVVTRCETPSAARLGIAITTYGRPDECADLVRTLVTMPEREIGAVVVVDQSAAADARTLGASLTELDDARVTHVRQPNWGGSGGFSRGMLELLDRADLTHVGLMDDDVVCDPTALRRALALASAGYDGMIGAQMLSLESPTRLHATAEGYDERKYIWYTPRGGLSGVDLSQGISQLLPGALHHTADFCPWWTAIIPLRVLSQHGLSLPAFIKFDDTEFSLRMRDQGVSLTMLLGCGVWHVPWTAKDTATDWQLYFLVRNRILTAATRANPSAPWLMLGLLWARCVLHCSTGAYVAAERMCLAIEDAAAGLTGLQESFALGREVAESRITAESPRPANLPSAKDRNEVRSSLGNAAANAVTGFVGAMGGCGRTVTLDAQQVSPLTVGAATTIYVQEPGSKEVRVRQIDAPTARSLTLRCSQAVWRLARRWRSLVAETRAELDAAVSVRAWRERLRAER